jgi:two-component system sensor histidine kinase QseC
MKTSIRKFLLINLLIAITITTMLTVVGNYYLDKKDIQEHVDSLNIATSLSYIVLPGAEIMDLGQHAESTHALGWKIIIDDLYIMLLIFPLSGLLIWIIIGRGLDSLDRVAVEVSNRAPAHLEPVRLESVPEEIRPLVDELNHLFLRLRDGFEREKRFAADAAHELKTPLAAIKVQAQVALNSPHVEEKDAALHKLIASVNRSTHIIQQLLIMSTLVPEAFCREEQESIQLSSVVRDVLMMLAPVALERRIELALQKPDDVLIIKGNSTALTILFRNLIDNAIRYGQDNGVILVRMKHDEEHVVVEVCDEGPGIPSELHERVFERFFRILGNKSTGSGLGLAISHQICQMHGAKITLNKPEASSGLVVKIIFPIG